MKMRYIRLIEHPKRSICDGLYCHSALNAVRQHKGFARCQRCGKRASSWRVRNDRHFTGVHNAYKPTVDTTSNNNLATSIMTPSESQALRFSIRKGQQRRRYSLSNMRA